LPFSGPKVANGLMGISGVGQVPLDVGVEVNPDRSRGRVGRSAVTVWEPSINSNFSREFDM
jgi:hypothetical protein